MSTTTNLDTLKINYLTQDQYDTAFTNNQINANQLYFTSDGTYPATQVEGTSNIDYRILLSTSANNTEETNTVRKSGNLTFNPSTSTLKIGDLSTLYSTILYGNPSDIEGLVFANSTSSGTGQYETRVGPRGIQILNTGSGGGAPNPSSTTAGFQSRAMVYGGAIGTMDNTTWASSTNGVYFEGGKNTAGEIQLRDNSTTSATITVDTISQWNKAPISSKYNMSSSGTQTVTLDSGNIYLLVAKRMNNSNTTGGLYIISAYTNNSAIATISEASSCTVSVSGLTLTITTTVNNIYCRLIKL